MAVGFIYYMFINIYLPCMVDRSEALERTGEKGRRLMEGQL
jgi:hypothetical protein